VGSGVGVGEIRFVGREEIVAAAVATVAAREAHADNAIVPSSRLNKKYFPMVENLRAPRCALIACERRRESVVEIKNPSQRTMFLFKLQHFMDVDAVDSASLNFT
jgi:hypothetical protein